MDSLAPFLAIGFSLLVLYLTFRVLTSGLFWKLAVVGAIVFGFTTGWSSGAQVLLFVALILAWFFREPPPGWTSPPIILQARDSYGRPSGNPNFQKGPPGPNTGYR